jgi:hypothetical protein
LAQTFKHVVKPKREDQRALLSECSSTHTIVVNETEEDEDEEEEGMEAAVSYPSERATSTDCGQ